MDIPTVAVNACDFTEDDFAAPPILGPEYHASTRLAEAMMSKFDTDHLKPLVDKLADEFRDKLWSDVADWLLADTEQNVAGSIRHMVEQTIDALLTGKDWAMKRYPYADYSKGQEIREAVAKHGGDELLMRRIVDLEAELKKANERIEVMRRY